MKKEYDYATKMDILREFGQNVTADYGIYFIKNDIDFTKQRDLPVVKKFLEVNEFCDRALYDCKTDEEINAAEAYLMEAKKYINEYEI